MRGLGPTTVRRDGLTAAGNDQLPDLTQPLALLDLSDEVLETVGYAVLANCPRDALRFCCASLLLRTKLERLKALVTARRLHWQRDLAADHSISDNGLTLVSTRSPGSDQVHPWVAGGLLPFAPLSSSC